MLSIIGKLNKYNLHINIRSLFLIHKKNYYFFVSYIFNYYNNFSPNYNNFSPNYNIFSPNYNIFSP